MLALITLLMVRLPTAAAHHSAAMFDFSKRQQLEGIVKEIRVINPHMSLTLVVSDGNGTRDVAFEGHSVNNFYRAGWRPNMVKVGDKIKVTYAPRKDGLDGGFVNAFVTAEGREIGFKPPGEATSGAAPAGSARPEAK
jgi:hypothetical protein